MLDTSYASKEPSERFDRRREFRFPWSHSRTSRRCRSQAAAIQARPQVRSPFSEEKKATEDVWFTENPLGKNSICEMMQRILQKAGLSKTYTNHSVRATCFTRLAEFGVDGHIIMATSGAQTCPRPTEVQLRRTAAILTRTTGQASIMNTTGSSLSGTPSLNPARSQPESPTDGKSMTELLLGVGFVSIRRELVDEVREGLGLRRCVLKTVPEPELSPPTKKPKKPSK